MQTAYRSIRAPKPATMVCALVAVFWAGTCAAQSSVSPSQNAKPTYSLLGNPNNRTPQWPTYTNPYPDFFNLAVPGTLSAILFGGGFASDQYGTIQEGFQLEQSVTRYIGVVGRVTGYQLFLGDGFDSPLAPGTGHRSNFNFGRFEGGLDFVPFSGTHLIVLGGGDAGDSHAAVVEGDLSTWLLPHTLHPFNFSTSVTHDYQNGVTSISLDLVTVAYSGENVMVMAGGGGALYSGGFISGTAGEGGPDLSFYFRNWRFGVSVQGGYGSAHQYGQVALYKLFNWTE